MFDRFIIKEKINNLEGRHGIQDDIIESGEFYKDGDSTRVRIFTNKKGETFYENNPGKTTSNRKIYILNNIISSFVNTAPVYILDKDTIFSRSVEEIDSEVGVETPIDERNFYSSKLILSSVFADTDHIFYNEHNFKKGRFYDFGEAQLSGDYSLFIYENVHKLFQYTKNGALVVSDLKFKLSLLKKYLLHNKEEITKAINHAKENLNMIDSKSYREPKNAAYLDSEYIVKVLQIRIKCLEKAILIFYFKYPVLFAKSILRKNKE